MADTAVTYGLMWAFICWNWQKYISLVLFAPCKSLHWYQQNKWRIWFQLQWKLQSLLVTAQLCWICMIKNVWRIFVIFKVICYAIILCPCFLLVLLLSIHCLWYKVVVIWNVWACRTLLTMNYKIWGVKHLPTCFCFSLIDQIQFFCFRS